MRNDQWLALVAVSIIATLAALLIYLPEWAVTLWSFLSTLSIPVLSWLCYRWGVRDSKIESDGIDKGVGAVVNAADRVSRRDKQVAIEKSIRPPARDPAVESYQPVLLIPAGRDQEIIDL